MDVYGSRPLIATKKSGYEVVLWTAASSASGTASVSDEALLQQLFAPIGELAAKEITVPVADLRPSFAWIQGRLSAQHHLISPLLVTIESEDGGVLVSEDSTGTYGAGRSYKEAEADLRSMLDEMYEQLAESEAELSETLRAKLHYLRSIIKPV